MSIAKRKADIRLAQARYVANHPEKVRESQIAYSKKKYAAIKEDPEKLRAKREYQKVWAQQNRKSQALDKAKQIKVKEAQSAYAKKRHIEVMSDPEKLKARREYQRVWLQRNKKKSLCIKGGQNRERDRDDCLFYRGCLTKAIKTGSSCVCKNGCDRYKGAEDETSRISGVIFKRAEVVL